MKQALSLCSLVAVVACSAVSATPTAPPGAGAVPAGASSGSGSTGVAAASTAVASAAVSAAPTASATAADMAAPEPPRATFKVTPAMCRCYSWSLTGENKKVKDPCDGVTDSVLETFAEECVRAHDPTKDCPNLIACNNLEPSGYAKCLPGEKFYATSTCGACRCEKEP